MPRSILQLTAETVPTGTIAARLDTITDAAFHLHDSADLHALLAAHALHPIGALLRRAHEHRGRALRTLRRLADNAHDRPVDPTTAAPRLAETLPDLAAAGLLLVAADVQLLHALQGGECYLQ